MDTLPRRTPKKQCTGPCGRRLPATLEYFYAHNEGKGGLNPTCKKCVRARVNANKRAHPDEVHARQKAYNRTNAAMKRDKQAIYRQIHPDQKRIWDDTHIEERRAYRLLHASDYLANGRNYTARKKGNGGRHTAQDVQVQYNRQKGKCYYCQVKVGKTYHVDHVIPLARGGSNGPENIVIACPFCNMSKNKRLPHEWPKGGRLL